MSSLLVVFGIFVVLGIWVISSYNTLVALFNRAQNAFGQIDVQLKRRYDLIPNLVEVAKKYMSHEERTLLKVIEARNVAKGALDSCKDSQSPESMAKMSEAQKGLNHALQGLNITMEAYPDLKANTNLIQLNEELSSTENKIAFARQAYNDSATNYNIARESFPMNIVASFFKRFHNSLGMLEFDENRETLNRAPQVKFD